MLDDHIESRTAYATNAGHSISIRIHFHPDHLCVMTAPLGVQRGPYMVWTAMDRVRAGARLFCGYGRRYQITRIELFIKRILHRYLLQYIRVEQ